MNPITEFLYTTLDRIFLVAAGAGAEPWITCAQDGGGAAIAAVSDDGTRTVAGLAASEWDEGAHIALHDPQAVIAWAHSQRELVQLLEALITTAHSVVDDPMAAALLTGAATRALRIMTSPYVHSPGFNPDWFTG